MSENKAINSRHRVFNLLLYPDCPEHKKAIERLISPEMNAVGILHNMDTYTEDKNEHIAGELKKEHYHFIVKFKNNRTKSALAKDLQIEDRMIDTTVSFKASAKYLLHMGCEDKYQYDADDLVGVLAPDVVKLLDDTSEEVKAMSICRLLDDFECFVSEEDFTMLCCKYGLYSVFRRNAYWYGRILDRHNLKYADEYRANT